jgi:hypothetical protein
MSTSKPMSDGGKGSVRRNEDTEAYRNNFDNIFRKKEQPMMNEDPQERSDEDYEEQSDEEYDDTCTWCGGCGEGDYDGASCRRCHGTGIEPCDEVDDDYT